MVSYFMKRYAMSEKGAINLKKAIISHTFVNLTKLFAPMIAFMFGVWYLAVAIGHKLAAVVGGQIDNITKEYSLSTFFLIFTIVPAVAGTLIILINPFVKKLMHGVK